MLKPEPKGFRNGKDCTQSPPHHQEPPPTKQKSGLNRDIKDSPQEKSPAQLVSKLIGKTTPFFICMCYFEGSPPKQKTLGHYAGGLCSPNFICSHGNISFLQNRKEVRKSKESCLRKERLKGFHTYVIF